MRGRGGGREGGMGEDEEEGARRNRDEGEVGDEEKEDEPAPRSADILDPGP